MQFSKLFLTLAAPAYVLAAASLRDIAPLPSDEVTIGCFNQYNAPIPSCTTAELKSKTCSADCVTDLSAHATDVILACRLAFVGPDTLLRKIMDGGLVSTLCPTVKDETSSDDEEEEETVSTTAVRSATPTSKTAGTVETDAAEEDTNDDGAEDESPAQTTSGAEASETPEAGEGEETQGDDILGGGAQDDEDDEGAAGKNVVVGWALGMVVAAVAAVVV